MPRHFLFFSRHLRGFSRNLGLLSRDLLWHICGSRRLAGVVPATFRRARLISPEAALPTKHVDHMGRGRSATRLHAVPLYVNSHPSEGKDFLDRVCKVSTSISGPARPAVQLWSFMFSVGVRLARLWLVLPEPMPFWICLLSTCVCHVSDRCRISSLDAAL